jgi:hypothetical protein
MEIVREDAEIKSDDDRDAALAKLERRTAELNGADAASVRARLAVMLGLRNVEEALPEIRPADMTREMAWALREYLAAVAREPAVMVIDDLQWAEQAVFDIVEGLAERAEDAPLLLLCVARPQLLELHHGWAAGRANAATITLDALSVDETTTLIARLLDVDDLPADLRARVVQRSEGNPLFCEEFLRMLIDDGRVERVGERWRATASVADVRVPESIHALLGARLDGLGDDEKRAIQVASIVGERFAAAEIASLAPDLDVARSIAGLRRSGLVLEDRETREAGRYRFKHLLMRDVAYAALPKAFRADLHEAFARDLERGSGDRRDEVAEIVAYHVERAFVLSVEVRAPRTVLEPRARAALDRAMVLGERARRRQDVGLLHPNAKIAEEALAALDGAATADDRLAVALLEADDRRLGAAYAEARTKFEEAARLATQLSRPDLAARAHLGAAQSLVWIISTSEDIADFMGHLGDAQRLFGEVGDAGGQIEAELIALEALWSQGRLDELMARGRALHVRVREIGDLARELQLCGRLISGAFAAGYRDESSAYAARTTELVAQLGARRPPWSRVSQCARIRADGDLEAAKACYAEFGPLARTDQDPLWQVIECRNGSDIRVLEERNYSEGLEFARRGVDTSVRLGEWWNRVELTGTLAVATAGTGDIDEADRLLSDDTLKNNADIFASSYWAHCHARVHELAGRTDEALAAYEDAERRYEQTDYRRMFWNGLVHLDHAALLASVGSAGEAAAHLAMAEAILGQQRGARAERITALRQAIAKVGARP